jgi:hypothetical protein
MKIAAGSGSRAASSLNVGEGWHVELFKNVDNDEGPVGSYWGVNQINSLAQSGYVNDQLGRILYRRA